MYILILDFKLVGGGGGGGGRERNVYLHIGQIMQCLSLTSEVVGGKKIAFVLVVVPVVFSSGYSRPHTIHLLLVMHNVYCAMEAQLEASSLLETMSQHTTH